LPNKSPTERRELSISDFEGIGIPPRFAGIGPDLAQDARKGAKSTKDTIEIFRGLRTPKKGLLIIGKRGTGKTTQIAEIAKAALGYCLAEKTKIEQMPAVEFTGSGNAARFVEKPKIPKVLFITFWQFIAELRESYKSGTRYVENLSYNDILFFDDLGKVEVNRDWFIEAFQELIDNLYNAKPGSKILYITSNFSGEEIAGMFGDACKDRIDDLCYTVELEGKSLRG